ncbi:MAG: adenosine deaminase, partial [Proteobacteria bacterium]|nr:adenosine deaminase [Pseudomonadota bacterium]
GVIYVEPMLAVNLLKGFGISYQDSFKTVAEAIDQANKDFGIEARILLVLLRHKGPEVCLREVNEVLELNPRYLVGVGLAGDEVNFPGRLFKDSYRVVEKAGLGRTAHSGEWSGPDSMRETIDTLGVTRLGHGVLCFSDEKLMRELANNKIHCEVCPGSNISLGVFKSFDQHPLRIMYDAGISLSLNSDDPPFFGTSMLKEYQNAVEHFNFNASDLLKVTRYGIEASFAEPALKEKLLKKIA